MVAVQAAGRLYRTNKSARFIPKARKNEFGGQKILKKSGKNQKIFLYSRGPRDVGCIEAQAHSTTASQARAIMSRCAAQVVRGVSVRISSGHPSCHDIAAASFGTTHSPR